MKIYLKVIFTLIAMSLLTVSCGENSDFKEINREMENFEWRIGRLKSVIESMKAPEISENRKSFEWYIDEFEKMYSRLEIEIKDVEESEIDDTYSSDEIQDVRDIITDLIGDVNTLSRITSDAIKGVDVTGPKDLKEAVEQFRDESNKLGNELARLRSSFEKLKMDKPIKDIKTDTLKKDSLKTAPETKPNETLKQDATKETAKDSVGK